MRYLKDKRLPCACRLTEKKLTKVYIYCAFSPTCKREKTAKGPKSNIAESFGENELHDGERNCAQKA